MKRLMLILTLVLAQRAMANIECAGRAADGTFVHIEVQTLGATQAAGPSSVTFEAGGNKFGYRMQANEVVQFFQYDDMAAKTAMVGLSAYAQKNFPVSIKYDGPNFVDMDLKAEVDAGKVGDVNGVMRVWKGPGHGTDQYQVSKPICSVWSNL